MTETPTTEKASAAASTAAEEAQRVAGVAKDQAHSVAAETSSQVRTLVEETRGQVGEQLGGQTREQRDKLVATLGTLGDDLEQMAQSTDGPGLAADLAREAAGHARSLRSHLDGREPGELLGDVRDFARRRPGTFLLGALLAGAVAGRLARGVKDADDAPDTSSPGAAPSTPDPEAAPEPGSATPPSATGWPAPDPSDVASPAVPPPYAAPDPLTDPLSGSTPDPLAAGPGYADRPGSVS